MHELQQQVYNIEMARIQNLSIQELKKEIVEWFQGEELPKENYTRDQMEYEYITDFMRYREEESEKELKEWIKNNK